MSELVPFSTDAAPAVPMLEKVRRLERAIMDAGIAVEFPVVHHFSKGVYARELFIPAGHVLTGKMHKHTNLNIISKGAISVLTEDGMKLVTAPATIVSPPGTKRVGYAHEDTIWTTIHGTDETDLDKIEAEFIVAEADEEMFLAHVAQLKLEGK